MPTRSGRMRTQIGILRRNFDLPQDEFWGRIGVSQSTGSRYETGTEIPKPIAMLVDLAYGPVPLHLLAKIRGEQLDEMLRRFGYAAVNGAK